jgi:phosphoribosylformylglycinamidine synthase subunit PurQ / glutaminase
MKVAILQFPGSNCDWDAEHAVQDVLNVPAKRVWHKSGLPAETEAVIVPGGFSFGDYLRCGAIARFSPIMNDLKEFVAKGGQVLGICNGFQILCEAGLLPGALVRNDCIEFRCLNQALRVENSNERFNQSKFGSAIALPIAHGEGNYRADEAVLEELEANAQVLLRYEGNPNGSINDIAGIRNQAGNVYGMMPHPERAVEPHHPCQDGLPVLESFLEPIRKNNPIELSAS